jgi:hypothetical protein
VQDSVWCAAHVALMAKLTRLWRRDVCDLCPTCLASRRPGSRALAGVGQVEEEASMQLSYPV